MTRHRVPRTRLGLVATAGACVLLVLSLSAFSLSPDGTLRPRRRPTASTQTGVTPKTIKVGHRARRTSTASSSSSTRSALNQQQVYQAFIDDINAKGGIDGRKIVPIYDTYCPLGSAGLLAVCTKFTDDDKVFAVIGHVRRLLRRRADLRREAAQDRADDVQPHAADHRQVAAGADDLSGRDQRTHGQGPAPAAEARRSTFKGKKVAVLGGSAEANTVNKTIVPGLKKLERPDGLDRDPRRSTGPRTRPPPRPSSTASSRSGRAEHVNAIFLSGDEVSSKQFVDQAAPGDAEGRC